VSFVAKQTSKKSRPASKAAPKSAAGVRAPAHKLIIKQHVPKQPAGKQSSIKPGSMVRAGAAPHISSGPVVPANGRPIPLVSVPTNGRPRKNQAGLTSREVEMFRALLLEKRRELVGDVSSIERDSLRASSGSNLSNLPLHMADMGTDNYEQEFTIGLMEKDRKLLKELNHALAKIQDGSYGICEGTGQPISKVRLEAQPWARFSIDYARRLEHGGIGRITPD
jgi:RNA polymerase-binding protein DksA